MTNIEMNVRVHVIHHTHGNPVMLTLFIFCYLDIVPIQVVYHPMIVTVGTLDGHVFGDLALHSYYATSYDSSNSL